MEAIQFETGRAACSKNINGCERMALWMNENPEVSVLIEGHTDDKRGFNLELSMSRAQNAQFLNGSGGVCKDSNRWARRF